MIKMKITTFMEFIIILSCFLLTEIPQYFSIPILSSGWTCMYIVFIFAILSLFLYNYNIVGLRVKTLEYCLIYRIYVPIMLVGLIMEYYYTMNEYNSGILSVLVASINFYYIFILPVIILSFINHGGISNTLEKLNRLCFCILLIYVVVFLLYKVASINLFNVSIRFNNIRLNIPVFSGLLLMYNFWMYIEFKSKHNLMMMLLLAFAVYVMSGTRMEMISCSIGLAGCYLSKKRNLSGQILVIMGSFVIVALLYYLGVFDSVLASFGESSSEYISTKVRLEAIEYFYGYLKEAPLFGMGFLRGGVNSRWDAILYGPWRKYVFSDLGLLGFILKTGGCAMLLVGVPLIRLVYIFIFSHTKSNINKYTSLITGIFFYFCVCQISLAFTDVKRGLVLPIIWAIFEYCAHHRGFAKDNKGV